MEGRAVASGLALSTTVNIKQHRARLNPSSHQTVWAIIWFFLVSSLLRLTDAVLKALTWQMTDLLAIFALM